MADIMKSAKDSGKTSGIFGDQPLSWILILSVFFCLAQQAKAERRQIFVGLGEDQNSLLLKSELTRKWQSYGKTPAEKQKLIEYGGILDELNRRYLISFVDEKDIPFGVKKPAIRYRSRGSDWESYPERCFQITGYPLLSTKWLISRHFIEQTQDEYRERAEELKNIYIRERDRRTEEIACQLYAVLDNKYDDFYLSFSYNRFRWISNQYQWLRLPPHDQSYEAETVTDSIEELESVSGTTKLWIEIKDKTGKVNGGYWISKYTKIDPGFLKDKKIDTTMPIEPFCYIEREPPAPWEPLYKEYPDSSSEN